MNGQESSELERVAQALVQTLYDGLIAGHYEFGVEINVIGGRKREVVVTAGRKQRFVLRGDELPT